MKRALIYASLPFVAIAVAFAVFCVIRPELATRTGELVGNAESRKDLLYIIGGLVFIYALIALALAFAMPLIFRRSGDGNGFPVTKA